jgi:hypothetical protein
MVELLEGFPDHVAAYRAAGKVTSDEYKRIVMRRVDEVAERYGKINFLVKLETDIENYDLPAIANYVKISFEHFSKWNRMAIVSDERWVRFAYNTLSPLVPGVIKGFTLDEYETARKWVSAPLEEK